MYLSKLCKLGIAKVACTNPSRIKYEIDRIDLLIQKEIEWLNRKKETQVRKTSILEKLAGLSDFFGFLIPMQVSVAEMMAFQSQAERKIKEQKKQIEKSKRNIKRR